MPIEHTPALHIAVDLSPWPAGLACSPDPLVDRLNRSIGQALLLPEPIDNSSHCYRVDVPFILCLNSSSTSKLSQLTHDTSSLSPANLEEAGSPSRTQHA